MACCCESGLGESFSAGDCCGSGCASSPSASSSSCGNWVARGANTNEAAICASSSVQLSLSSNAALARAALSASEHARKELTPSAIATEHKASIMASGISIFSRRSRAAVISSAEAMSVSIKRGEIARRSISKAIRSHKASGKPSSSGVASSSATTPNCVLLCWRIPSRSTTTCALSIACVIRAAVAREMRSAILSTSTPPSTVASKPDCDIGRPADKVAGKSSPPSKRSSVTDCGTRIQARSPMKAFNIASQASRTGPACARTRTPPKPAGSIANRTATRIASSHALPDGSGSRSRGASIRQSA